MAAIFDAGAYLNGLSPIMRRKKFTYGDKDTINQFVFSKRQELEPHFVIPQAHQNKWQPVPADDSDSAYSEVDSDEDTLRFIEQVQWLNELFSHLQIVFNLLNNAQGRTFAVEFANIIRLTVKQRTRLNIL